MKMAGTRGRVEFSSDELEPRLQGTVGDWLDWLASRASELGALLAASPAVRERRGYDHTLREICQQPATWIETAARVERSRARLAAALAELGGGDAPGALLLTGSGSSLYVGECLALGLQAALGLAVQAVAAGTLLTHTRGCLPARGPALLVSFARSGNSPESCGALEAVRAAAPACRHVVITCNGDGQLATRYRDDPRVERVVLHERTCDRSLVMTSSFTNMALAGQVLADVHDGGHYLTRARVLARAAAALLVRNADALARLARAPFASAVYLGSGDRYGAAREGALKLVEMTAGRVKAFPETYLGLRHGPMCAVDDGTLVVCLLASDPVTRAYELDLVRELNRKRLGAVKLLFGSRVPPELAGGGDLVLDLPELEGLRDEELPLLDVLVGQLVAFFRCLQLGLRPDEPPTDGVIHRVVEPFALHRPARA
jgi:tagatose-6-phosphate ketose/aldose isomerase